MTAPIAPGLAPLGGRSRHTGFVIARVRRVGAAGLVGLAGYAALAALAPDPEPVGIPVLVAVRDLPAGHRLTAEDLRTEHRPTDQVPAEPVTRLAGALEQVLTSSVLGGEPLAQARLRGGGLLAGQPVGTLAVPVPVLDPGVAQVVRVGDRVRALAPADGSTLGEGVVLLVRSGGGDGLGGLTSNSAGVLVLAVSESTARGLSVALGDPAGGGGVLLAIVAEPPA